MKMSTTISISDFKRYRKDNYYYVDKTLFIEELFTKGDQVVLLPRPRRFGKTLNLSMLKYYFDVREDNKHLFKDLKIEQSDVYEEHINKYPTIFLTLKEVKGLSWKEIYGDFKLAISKLYEEHLYLLDSDKLDNYNKELIIKIIKREVEIEDYKHSLKTLSEYMYKHYDKEVVILLDEYDTMLNTLYDQDTYNNIINFMRVFIGSAFKGNNYLFKGVITGILRIAKESIFSGANNIQVRTIIDNDFSDKFGFTEDEVINMLKYNNLENNIDNIREWYNGYTFGKSVIYNPYSIANYVQKKSLEPYWVNSGDLTLIKNLLIDSDIAVKEKLEELIKGSSIDEEIETNIILSELSDARYLWSLLLFTGYLKCTSIDRKLYRLSIPNEELMDGYKSIMKSNFNKITKNSLKIIEAIRNNDIQIFKEELGRIVINVLSNYDTLNENAYHMFIIGLLSYLEEYEVKSNRESGYGRYDIAIIPKDIRRYGYIIELKVAKGDIEKECKEGIEQIEKKEYKTEVIGRGVKNIILISIAFKGKKIYTLYKSIN